MGKFESNIKGGQEALDKAVKHSEAPGQLTMDVLEQALKVLSDEQAYPGMMGYENCVLFEAGEPLAALETEMAKRVLKAAVLRMNEF